MSMQYKVRLPIKRVEKYKWGTNSTMTIAEYPTDAQIEIYKQWCKTHIGSNKWNYYGKYRKVPCEFRFKEEQDAVAFKLTFVL